jgi:hypothetical protein
MQYKRRVFVMTDISTLEAGKGEPDDTQSLVRLLLYANEMDLVGFAATYTVHTEGVNPDYIRQIIESYRQIHRNLLRHDPSFPSAEKLLNGLCSGCAKPGLDKIGGESEAARRILLAADMSEESLWIIAWGGVTDLAMALRIAREEKDAGALSLFIAKLRIYAINDQYDNCGPWIREQFPDLFYITNHRACRGMYRLGDQSLCSPAWIEEHLAKSPLIDAYPVYRGGDIYVPFFGRVEGLSEGDSPSFLYLANRGPGDPDHPEYGGWGGRFVNKSGTRHYFDAADTWNGIFSEWASVFRYRADVQTDFALRSRWCLPDSPVLPYPELNLSAPSTTLPAGGIMELKAELRSVPAEPVEYSWTCYPEAGSFESGLFIKDPAGAVCGIMSDRRIAKGGKAHIICRVSTSEAPARISYRRLILSVEGNNVQE